VRRWAVRRWALDAAIAAAVTAVQLGGTYADSSRHVGGVRVGTLTYVLLAVGGAALILRRRYPVGVLAVTLATTLWAAGQNGRAIYLALIVAFFSAVLAKKRVAAIASLVIGYVASVWPVLIGESGHPSTTFAVGLAAGLIFLLSAAELIRSRNQRTAALARSRTEELRRLAGEERMKMARDLHDVVAHNISVINVQANTALHLMDRQPERARQALTTINEVSKQALVELRSVLGVLRDVDESAPRSPSPGLERLGDLVDSAAAAGLTVHVEPPDGPAPLPAEVDLAAYRIVQEALTNSARHSGGSTATVRITPRSGGLLVEVADNGKGRPGGSGSGPRSGPGSGSRSGPGSRSASGSGSGHGIAGMTERAKVLGGTLHAGPRPDGGFEVQAWLPVDRSEP
jgi:signal transduction histidine kinase